MKIALFYNKSPGTVGEYFHRALLSLGEQVDHYSIAGMTDPPSGYDVFLRVDHGDYATDLPRSLKPKAFYAVDTHLHRSWDSIRRLAEGYDLLLCAQQLAARCLPRAVWVPLGCDPEIHGQGADGTTSNGGNPLKYDLAFVGNDGGIPRKFLLQEMRERYPNSFIGRAPHTQMREIYGQAKLGFHYIECTSPLKDHVSMRVYEVLASGSLLLANALAPGAFESVGLKDGEHLTVYRNPKELFERVDHYLSHEEERRRIAAAGSAAVLRHHTYRQRAETSVQHLEELSSRAKRRNPPK